MKINAVTKLLAFFTLLLFIHSPSIGQNSDMGTFSDRVFIGGGIGGGFSNTYAYIEVSPMAGYMINERWAAGLGLRYQYSQDKIYDFSRSVIGPYIFTRYQLLDFAFIYAEYEHLFLKYKDVIGGQEYIDNVVAPGLLLGGGISSGFGKSMAFLMILYNVTEGPYTPYANPVIRMGVSVGL